MTDGGSTRPPSPRPWSTTACCTVSLSWAWAQPRQRRRPGNRQRLRRPYWHCTGTATTAVQRAPRTWRRNCKACAATRTTDVFPQLLVGNQRRGIQKLARGWIYRRRHGQSDAHGALLYCVACSLTTRREETCGSLDGSPAVYRFLREQC
jgi:hypothetical protein